MLLALVCLVGCLMFVCLTVDVGYLDAQKTKMQNAVDAAALAAAQELTSAIANAPPGTEDPTAYALESSRSVAVQVAQLNGVYVDRQLDVRFGRRTFTPGTGESQIEWGASPSNVVEVTARRTGEDTSAEDGKLKLFFAGITGDSYAKVQANAKAYIEARDIVVVHDFSRSMNFDSQFSDEATAKLSDEQIVTNLNYVWTDLNMSIGNLVFEPKPLKLTQSQGSLQTSVTFRYNEIDVSTNGTLNRVKVRYGNNSEKTWSNQSGKTGTYSVNGDIKKVWVRAKPSGGSKNIELEFTDDNDAVRQAFGLNGSYPFPSGSWNEYIKHCREYQPFISRGYRETYGGLTFANYLIRLRSSHSETPALCQVRHYPFTCLKEGHQVLCDFLNDLSFDDHLGMVSYDTNHRVESILNVQGLPYVNISNKPITNDYDAVNNLMKYKQANHYSAATNMGGGLKSAIQLLDNHRRLTARPTILLMTDGNSNTWDNGENGNLPGGWDWNELLDYDNDGAYDYYANNSHQRYVLKKAYEAVQKGYTIHTMSVGMDADRDLMRAVAHIGGGYFIDIPGGFSVLDMEEDVKAAFHKIASMVPPPKLLNE